MFRLLRNQTRSDLLELEFLSFVQIVQSLTPDPKAQKGEADITVN